MNYRVFENYTEVFGCSDFNLRDTLLCGQCFRFSENPDGSFKGVAFGRELVLAQKSDSIVFYCDEKDFSDIWVNYFDLGQDYGEIKAELSALHPVLKEAARFAPGIRILRQEPFEALISFIISQNNNIKRISGIVERLCSLCGDQIKEGVFAFPRVDALAKLSSEDLAPIRAGFRAKYIVDAAQKVKSGELNLKSLESLEYDEAKKQLMKIKGVGPKVADCVLLYGLHRTEGFPMDVWMKRAMEKLFTGVSPSDFGKYAGIAQQYIFHYARLHPELFKEE